MDSTGGLDKLGVFFLRTGTVSKMIDPVFVMACDLQGHFPVLPDSSSNALVCDTITT